MTPSDIPPADEHELEHELSLRDAAAELDVHYMTAYRYVRNGRLPARKVGSEWRVRRSDLAAITDPSGPDLLRSASPIEAEGSAPRPGRSRDPRRLAARLVVGDEAGAWGVVEHAMSAGAEPAEVLTDLIASAMIDIGDRWERGELAVADEHRASAVAQRLIGRLGPRFARRGRKRGTIVIGAAPDDRHGLPAAILADLLRAERFEVIDLGADTPAQSFIDAARAAPRLVAIGMSVTCADGVASAPIAIAAIKVALPQAPIVIGGFAIRDSAHAADLGAALWAPGGRHAVELFDRLASDRPAGAA